jgi:SPP1 family predicted phage head-tail adaptor
MAKRIKIALQRSTEARSATGQIVDTWVTYATVWGSTKTLRGSAYYSSQQTVNQTSIEFYIHYRADVLPSDRAVVSGTQYEIAVPPENLDLKNRELLLRLRYVE